MSSPPTSTQTRLPLLDGLRGIAALLVVFHHEPYSYAHGSPFARAYLAVDFFFLLSGFVLTLAFEAKLNAGLDSVSFLRQRLIRLWPVMAVGIVIGAMGMALNHGAMLALPLLALSLLLIPIQIAPGAIYCLNGPQWSLSFELFANFMHALVLRRISDAAVLGVSAVCGLIMMAIAFKFGSLGFGDTDTNWWGGFFRVGFASPWAYGWPGAGRRGPASRDQAPGGCHSACFPPLFWHFHTCRCPRLRAILP